MQRVSTTVIGLVGARAREATEALGAAANVRAVIPDPDADPLDRAVEAWREASGAHVPYLAHDADPLADVADAWVRWYDQQGARGDLEVAVEAALTRWRARSVELPDYYLVLDAEALDATRRHFYLGYLRDAAPHRVVPVEAEPALLGARVSRLRAGRWWPDLDRLLADAGDCVPDALRGPDAAAGLGRQPGMRRGS